MKFSAIAGGSSPRSGLTQEVPSHGGWMMPPQVTAHVETARAAQRAWATVAIRERVDMLRRFRHLAFDARAQLAQTVAQETGKPVIEALVAEVAMVLESARFLGRNASRALAPVRVRPGAPALWRKRLTQYHDPFGVVAVISPWNYPLLLPALQVLPALVAGNAVVLKPSEYTPRTADLLVQLLHRAGVPPEVLVVAHGDGTVGEALVNAPIDKVFFTGSERTGRRIALACAPRFVPVSLELGGSDPAIILEDADLDVTADGIMWGRFANAGQTCSAIKRVIAVGASHDAIVARLKERIMRLRFGTIDDPDAQVGRMISPAQRALISAQLHDAIAQGVTVAARNDPPPDLTDTVWAPLVLLTDVHPSMRVWQEETFGPVLSVMRAASESEAITLANNTSFGLSASVWTRNRAHGHALARRIEAGAVAVNDSVLMAGVSELAHGGVKSSGMGRAHGLVGLMECVRTHTVMDDRFGVARQPWWFGYSAVRTRQVDGYLRFAYGGSVVQRLGGLPDSLRLLLRC